MASNLGDYSAKTHNHIVSLKKESDYLSHSIIFSRTAKTFGTITPGDCSKILFQSENKKSWWENNIVIVSIQLFQRNVK